MTDVIPNSVAEISNLRHQLAQREAQLLKCQELRKMYNDAGGNIHIHKMGFGQSDEEIDFNFQVAKTLGVFASEWGGAKGDQGIPSIFIFDQSGILRFKYISQTTADRPTFEYLMKILEIIGGL